MENEIKLYGVKWDVDTAGPSPDMNKRTEIFFFGCNRAVHGNPCNGCFNSALWDNSVAVIKHKPKAIVEQIKKHSSNKYVTIGGGEPADQKPGLIELCKLLKQEGFHIMMYTWRELLYNDKVNKYLEDILPHIDILVDGEFNVDERLYDDTKGDGLLSSVGSGNQIIWDINANEGFHMRDLDAIALDGNDRLIYFLKDMHTEPLTIKDLRKGE